MTSDAVLSCPIAACLIRRMTSGSMDVRNCFLSPEGGFRPFLGDGFASAIVLPARCAIPRTVPWVAGDGKGSGAAARRFSPTIGRDSSISDPSIPLKARQFQHLISRYIDTYSK